MNVVILGSGRGSNAEAILTAKAAGSLGKARVVALGPDQARQEALLVEHVRASLGDP